MLKARKNVQNIFNIMFQIPQLQYPLLTMTFKSSQACFKYTKTPQEITKNHSTHKRKENAVEAEKTGRSLLVLVKLVTQLKVTTLVSP